MTTAEVVAGRALDALVAEKVMGYVWARSLGDGGWAILVRGDRPLSEQQRLTGDERRDATFSHLPRFSKSIDAAWQVVERMRAQRRMVSVNWLDDSRVWSASIYRPPGEFGLPFDGDGDTAPEAICRAALAVMAATP